MCPFYGLKFDIGNTMNISPQIKLVFNSSLRSHLTPETFLVSDIVSGQDVCKCRITVTVQPLKTAVGHTVHIPMWNDAPLLCVKLYQSDMPNANHFPSKGERESTVHAGRLPAF